MTYITQIANFFVTMWNSLFTGLGGGVADFAKLLFLEHTVNDGVVTYTGDFSVFAIVGFALGALAGGFFIVRSIIRWVQARKGA